MIRGQVLVRDLHLVFAILIGASPIAVAASPEPQHKLSHRPVPPHAARGGSDVTGTVAKPQAERLPTTTATPNQDDVIPPPFKLPATSRERVRACGLVWHDMKIAGRTGDDDWRDFAEKCFVAKDPPTTTP